MQRNTTNAEKLADIGHAVTNRAEIACEYCPVMPARRAPDMIAITSSKDVAEPIEAIWLRFSGW